MGEGACSIDRCRGCRRIGGLVAVGGLHDRSRTSARDEHDAPHWGLGRTTRICGKSRLTTASVAHAAGYRPKSISSSMVTGCPWSPGSRPVRPVTRRCSCLSCRRTCALGVRSVGHAPDRTRYAATRRTRLARSARTYATAASRLSSPSPTTRRVTANAEDHEADAPSRSTRPTTGTATSSSAASATSSSGAAWPPETTNTRPPTEPRSSSTASSPGPGNCQTHPSRAQSLGIATSRRATKRLGVWTKRDTSWTTICLSARRGTDKNHAAD